MSVRAFVVRLRGELDRSVTEKGVLRLGDARRLESLLVEHAALWERNEALARGAEDLLRLLRDYLDRVSTLSVAEVDAVVSDLEWRALEGS